MPQSETTALTPAEETRFRAWVTRNKITDVDAPESHYDYRGYFKEFGEKPIKFGVDHFPDTYKQHGHPTFSEESKYSRGQGDGGTWKGETFVPSHKLMAQAPTGFVPDGFEPDPESSGPNLEAVGGDTIRGEDPNAPSLIRRLQDALGHAAQPESVGDFLSLLIPSEAAPVTTAAKDMARILRQATKESPSLRGILPKIVDLMRERPKNLQDFQSRGFNQLPLAQQMEHLPEVPAPPPGRMPAPLRTVVPPETPAAAASPVSSATVAATAGPRLTAEERQAVDLLVQQGHAESDVLAELEKLRQPSPKFTPTAIKLRMNAAETKEYLRLINTGKTPDEAAEMLQAQRAFVTSKGLQDTATVKSRIRERNATGRWED